MDPVVVLRRDPNFAFALHFLLLFQPIFPSLLAPSSNGCSKAELVVRLEWLLAYEEDPQILAFPFACIFRSLPGSPRFSSLLDGISKEYRKRDMRCPFAGGSVSSLLELSVAERVQVLADLIEMLTVDSDHFRKIWSAAMRDGQCKWRCEPLWMGKGHAYFVLEDARLYRQGPTEWELLAYNRREWQSFLASKLPKHLSQSIRQRFGQVLPFLQDVEREEKKYLRAAELAALPRKRSSRLQAVKSFKEQEVDEAERGRKRHAAGAEPKVESSPCEARTSREERMRQRAAKRLLSQHEQVLAGLKDGGHGQTDSSERSSPIKLVFRRVEEGYESSLAGPGARDGSGQVEAAACGHTHERAMLTGPEVPDAPNGDESCACADDAHKGGEEQRPEPGLAGSIMHGPGQGGEGVPDNTFQ